MTAGTITPAAAPMVIFTGIEIDELVVTLSYKRISMVHYITRKNSYALVEAYVMNVY
jgi:hypothetical protein